MKETVEALKGIAQFVTLAVTAIALATLVFAPEYFANRLAGVLRALDQAEVTATIRLPLLEAELARRGAELTQADERARAQVEELNEAGATLSENVDMAAWRDWAVITFSSPDIDAARRVVAKLEGEGFEAKIFQGGGQFQAAAIFDGRVAAENGAAVIKALGLSASPPYVRSLAVWCANRTPMREFPGVERCARSDEN